MTKFRAALGALAAGTLILAITQPVYAASTDNDLTGTLSTVDGACVAPLPFFNGQDCSYNESNPTTFGTFWLGPVASGGYYEVGQSPFALGTVDDTPVVGDNKFATPIFAGSTITIDDNGTPCTADDVISGTIAMSAATRAFAGGPGEQGEETWGDGGLAFPIPATTVDSASPNSGGCDYEIATAGIPPLLLSDGGGTFIFDVDIVETPVTATEDSWTASSPVGMACFTESNCGVSVDVTLGASWSCTDNTGGAGACAGGADGGGHFGGTMNTMENFLISVSTNSNGDISSGLIFAINESKVFSVPPDPFNSWNGPVLTFSGTCSNCKLANDDVYNILQGAGPFTLDIGANDSPDLVAPTTVAITTVPDMGGTADPVNNSPGPVQQITVDYSPSSAAFSGTETFVYEASDGVNLPSKAIVTVNVEEDTVPVATDVIRTISTLGVDPTSVTDTFDLLNSPGNMPGNGGLVDNPTNVVNGTATTDGINASFTPNASFIDAGSYGYTITDEQDDVSGPGTVTILAEPEDPVALDATAQTEAGVPVDIPILFELGNGSAAQHEVLAIANSGTCTVNLTTAIATYEPDDGFSGDDTCTYTISDLDGSTDDGIIIITVEDNVVIKFPGGSALDPWALSLLIGLPFLRRRRTH